MNRVNLTDYDVKPEGMVNYMRHYGPHFSRKLCEFAVSMMRKQNDEQIKFLNRDQVKEILSRHGITLKHD